LQRGRNDLRDGFIVPFDLAPDDPFGEPHGEPQQILFRLAPDLLADLARFDEVSFKFGERVFRAFTISPRFQVFGFRLRFEPDGVGEFFGFFENSRRFATRRDDLILTTFCFAPSLTDAIFRPLVLIKLPIDWIS
jgi:hypothetical protein